MGQDRADFALVETRDDQSLLLSSELDADSMEPPALVDDAHVRRERLLQWRVETRPRLLSFSI
ncbi:hypothetical protein N7475_004233 [Penicillium sp. IBT 31633x]|nr:hypothetical protein N7475_004233 [Penicillium sp. IBT 31633x]